MLKLEFKSGEFTTRSGTARNTGKPYQIHEQEAWLTRKNPNGTPSPYPEKIVLILDNDKPQPYEAGIYQLDTDAMIYIGDFSSLRLGRPVLKKIEQSAVKAA